MNTNDNRLNAHNEIDHIFKNLLPARNMAERPERVALCHRMLEAMLEGGIALCDASTGIGKTYAYLVAGTVYSRFRAVCGLEAKPILPDACALIVDEAHKLPETARRIWSSTPRGTPTAALCCVLPSPI